MSIEYGIGTVNIETRFEFGLSNAGVDEGDKYGFCDTEEELKEVMNKFKTPLNIYDNSNGCKYKMTENYEMKKVKTFKEDKNNGYR